MEELEGNGESSLESDFATNSSKKRWMKDTYEWLL